MRYHRCQTLGFKNGLPVQRRPLLGVGMERLATDLHIKGKDEAQRRRDEEAPIHDPEKYGKDTQDKGKYAVFTIIFLSVNFHLCYGKSRPKSAPAFRPRYCFLDKKVLRFFAHFEARVK